jgi:hypothetical protein
MEDLFATTNRFCDWYRALPERGNPDDYHFWGTEKQMNGLVEVELVTGSSAEDTFLHYGYTWNDFYSWADGKMACISPGVFFNLIFNMGSQTEYRAFLNVGCVPNEEDDTSEEPNS